MLPDRAIDRQRTAGGRVGQALNSVEKSILAETFE
jgi:hypothetical protein